MNYLLFTELDVNVWRRLCLFGLINHNKYTIHITANNKSFKNQPKDILLNFKICHIFNVNQKHS